MMHRYIERPQVKSHTSHRAGLSLLDVSVIVALIGVLLAILLPAVHSARAAASRVTCQNRLRQIGQALHGYLAAHDEFPAVAENRHSFLAALLPYVDQQAVYDRLPNDNDRPVVEVIRDADAAISEARIAVLVCPSDPVYFPKGTNYAGNRGTGWFDGGYLDNGENGFFATRPRRPQDFEKGLSQIAALSEIRHTSNATTFVETGGVVSIRADPQSLTEWNAFVDQCRLGAGQRMGQSQGMNWIRAGGDYTLYDHVLPPGSNTCRPTQGGFQLSIYSSHSAHSGGAHTLIGDGSVSFTSAAIDEQVWRSLGRRTDR